MEPMEWMALSALIGALMGTGKSAMDTKSAKRDMDLASGLMRVSPWTGMQPDPFKIKKGNTAADAMQGGLAGAALVGANSRVFSGEKTPETTPDTGTVPASPNMQVPDSNAWILMNAMRQPVYQNMAGPGGVYYQPPK